jgi:glycosyltransferase involved in cell wall biosynthesis
MLVSIILPVYNGARYLSEALESVLAQTHRSIELLIADDGSADGSWELVQQYAEKDSRIQAWRNEVRLGLFGNYNRTIKKANGEYIKLFAQDDLMAPTAIAVLANALLENPSAAIASCGRGVLEDPLAEKKTEDQTATATTTATTTDKPITLPPGLNYGHDVILKCLSEYRNLIGEPVTVMFRSKDRQMQFNENYLSLGDLELWFRFLDYGDLVYLPDSLVSFRRHKESQTQTLLLDLDWVLDFLRMSREYESYLKELGIPRQDYCMRFIELASPLVEANIRTDHEFVDSLPLHKELAYYLMRRLPSALEGQANYQSVLASTSWRVTRPLRVIKEKFDR